MDKKGRGIVIFACGNPLYGTSSYNLAMSLKAMGEVEIAIMFNGAGLSFISESQLEFFDHVIHIDENIPANTMVKLHANEFSPFEKTIVFDADMLWLPFKNPNELFDQLDQVVFTGITEGKEDHLPDPKYFFWADVAEIKAQYQLKVMLYQWRTEFIYFNLEGGKIVDRALEICKTHKLASVKNFAHNTPDELGVNIATAEAGIEPHKYRFIPAFWAVRHGNRIPGLQTMSDNGYYMMSFGSNFSNQTIKGVYDIIMSHACNHFERQHIFRLTDKKHNIAQRETM